MKASRFLSAITAVALCAMAHAQPLASFEAVYGPGDVTMLSGNGGLTVGVNRSGRVSVCRWPSPGYYDQLGYRTISREEASLGVQPGDGLFWGLEIDGEIVWLTDARWETTQRYDAPTSSVMVTHGRWPAGPVAVTQYTFVLPSSDVLVSHLSIEGFDTSPRVFWFSNFTPCTRKLPEMPIADWLLDSRNDFAAFADPANNRVVHFRPEQPGQEDWQRARAYQKGDAGIESWASFADGAWIAYGCTGGMRAAWCGSGESLPTGAVQQLGGAQDRVASAVGDCYSIAEVAVSTASGRHLATVFAGFGDSLENAEAILSAVEGVTLPSLVRLNTTGTNRVLELMSFPDTDNRAVRQVLQRAVLTILAATDRASGSAVRSPVTQPPLARDWAQSGAWMIRALDLSGFQEAAESHLAFFMSHIRTEYVRGKPLGSLPTSMYTDGVESSPHVNVRAEDAAWVLWALREHLELMEGKRRDRFLASYWDRVELSADFLAGSAVAALQAPHGPEVPGTLERISVIRLGLASALEIARARSVEAPSTWVRRVSELDGRMAYFHEQWPEVWKPREVLPLVPDGLQGMGAVATLEELKSSIEALAGLTGYEAGRLLVRLATDWRDRPEGLALLREEMHDHLSLTVGLGTGTRADRVPPEAFPDAFAAALGIVAAHAVYGVQPTP